MTTHRPCGACAALVPADSGCAHWKPGATSTAARERKRRYEQKLRLEEYRRQLSMGAGVRG